MSSMWGERFRISLFGESHGEAVGVTIEGVKPGLLLDLDFIKSEMQRRMPGKDLLSTSRQEPDIFEILSGVKSWGYQDEKLILRATGTPMCVIIRNKDKRSQDYGNIELLPRPGHADYAGYVKYKGFNDVRGGGHFSGRITAGMVFAGAVAKLMLAEKGIRIGAHILRIYDVEDRRFGDEDLTEENFSRLAAMRIPVLQEEQAEKMAQRVLETRDALDSVGGIIETAVTGLPAGMGGPYFGSLESVISQVIFAVPAVKGIAFGNGFEFAGMKGSQANDPFEIRDGQVVTSSNNNGGINGGISNGMPVIFTAVIKPTSSIAQKQQTVNLKEMSNAELVIKGRHDPCIVIRAVPVIESATAIALADLLTREGYL